MKLFLNGGGDGPAVYDAYRQFAETINPGKPLVYVPLAMEPEKYPGCYEWITHELALLDLPGIRMVTSGAQLAELDLSAYAGVFIGGGNTFRLLKELKTSGAFEKLGVYLQNGGVIFGGSAGSIIFGESLESCALDDTNDVGLADISGFDMLGGLSLLCHYTNRSPKKDAASTAYLLELSKRRRVLALPEEDTLLVTGSRLTLIGSRPCYLFEGGQRTIFKV